MEECARQAFSIWSPAARSARAKHWPPAGRALAKELPPQGEARLGTTDLQPQDVALRGTTDLPPAEAPHPAPHGEALQPADPALAHTKIASPIPGAAQLLAPAMARLPADAPAWGQDGRGLPPAVLETDPQRLRSSGGWEAAGPPDARYLDPEALAMQPVARALARPETALETPVAVPAPALVAVMRPDVQEPGPHAPALPRAVLEPDLRRLR